MRWFLIILLVPFASSKYFGYRDVTDQEDSCDLPTDECATNQGIQGHCLNSCGAHQRMVEGKDLCNTGCKCCTEKRDNCDIVYPGSYCGPSPCDRRKIEISDSALCDNNHICCRTPSQAVAHQGLRQEAGAKGMKAHYVTFDGLRFKFGGLCTYLLMRQNTTESSNFHVWASHARVSDEHGKTRVMVKGVKVDYMDHLVELSEGNLAVLMDGINIVDLIDLKGEEYEDNDMLFSWVNNENRVRVEVPNSFRLEWNGRGHLIIDLHDSMIGTAETGGRVVGVLGNANGVRNDDLIERMYDDETYEIISELEGYEKPVLEDLIKVGISWMRDCDEVV